MNKTTMIDSQYNSIEDALKIGRKKIKMGQRLHYNRTNLIYEKIKGGWEIVEQRPVYVHCYLIEY